MFAGTTARIAKQSFEDKRAGRPKVRTAGTTRREQHGVTQLPDREMARWLLVVYSKTKV